MPQLDQKQKNRLYRLARVKDSGELGLIQEINVLDEKVDVLDDQLNTKIDSVSEDLTQKIDHAILISEEKTKGDQGEPGDDYVLTEADKKEIAENITVPIVDRVIEKTETIKEIPIVTEITKETKIENPVTGEDVVSKINSLPLEQDYLFPQERISGLKDEILRVEKRAEGFVMGANRNLNQLLDVSISGIAVDQSIKWDGTKWVSYTPSAGGGVSSVTANNATVVISPTTGGVLVERAAITGDVAVASGSNTSVLATVNANVGSFGSATQVALFTVNGKGLVTAASNCTIAIPSTQITDFTEASQDATGAMVGASLVYVDATPLLARAALTGDITSPQNSNATTLATVNSNVGTYNFATFTVNAKGLVTAASSGTSNDGSLGLSSNDICININHSNNWHCIQCFYPSNDNQTAVDIMGYSPSQVSPLFTVQHYCGGGCDIRAAIYEDGHACFSSNVYALGFWATCGIHSETVEASSWINTTCYLASGSPGCTGTITLLGLTNIQVQGGIVINWT